MPLSGTLDVAPLLDAAPRMDGFATEPWELPGCELLHLKLEIDERNMTASLPPALHPTIPPVVIATVASYPESPVGAFTLAQVRIGCRASALPRGYLLRAYVDSANARDELARRWGFDAHLGDVRIRRYHDRIAGTVTVDGAEIMRATLVNPEPISGGDIQYVASMHLARTPDDDGKGVLVQVDPEYRFHRAERGAPELSFDRAAWRAEGVDPVWPVAATFSLVDTGFPKIRYVLDPTKPAVVGTRSVA
jgi:hypothetical protein